MSDPAPARSISPGLLLALLCVTVAAAYWPGLGGAWVFDDFSNIVDNAELRVSWDSGWEQWRAAALSSASRDLPRPLAMLSFAVNHAWHGLDPFWMKLTNLAIHLLNTGLVFGLIRLLLRLPALQGPARSRSDLITLWIAAAWALNPINLMAVLFVVQRMESLSHSFVFAGLWLYLSGRARLRETGRGWIRMGLGLVAGASLGTLVKESAALLPLYAVLVEWALFSGRPMRLPSERRRMLGFFGLVLVIPGLLGLLRIVPRALHPNAYDGRDFTLLERLLTEARVLLDYIRWIVLPDLSRLSLYHDDYPVSHGLWSPPSTFWALLLLSASCAFAVWLKPRRPLAALGIAWFFGAHALTATIWPLELVFEHRNYFASLGLCLVLADVLLRMPLARSARRAGGGLALALLALYTGTTALRAREWSDQLRFSSTEAAKNPQSPRASYDLARNLVILTDFQSDSPYFAPALEALHHAMQVPGATPLPESAAILLASRAGATIQPEWWLGLKRKLGSRRIGLAETGALSTLSDCEIEGHCLLPQSEMVDAFVAALQRGPHPDLLHIYGGYALNALQDPLLALTLFQDAARLAPDEPEYRITLARLLIASGRGDEAIEHIEHLRRLGRWGQHESLAREMLHHIETTQAPPKQPVDTHSIAPIAPSSG